MISVLIPTFCTKDRHGLSRLYLSLLGFSNQTLDKTKYEVIIIDDGSEWDIKQYIQDWNLSNNFKVIKQKHKGMVSAYASGLKISEGEYIFFGIDDNIPHPQLLEEHLYENLKHDNVLIWGREYHMHNMKQVYNPTDHNNFRQHSLYQKEDKNSQLISEDIIINKFDSLIDNSKIIDKYIDIEELLTSYADLSKLCASFLVMRLGNQSLSKKLLHKVGGLDQSFNPSGWYMDLELGLRLIAYGTHFIFKEKAIMVHVSHNHDKATIKDEKIKHQYFYNKHPCLSVALIPIFFKSNLGIEAYSEHVEYLERLINNEKIHEKTMSK